MKLFLDTADASEIRRAQTTGLLDGVTTNPSLIAKTGRRFQDVVAEICGIVPGPVSAECMASSVDAMVVEAQSIAAIAPNVVVKIPMTVAGLTAVAVLESMSVHTNVTMTFSPTQAFLAMKSGASFVSIVLSRLDAVGHDSELLARDAMTVKRNYRFRSEIIAGSVKSQHHVLACLRAGVDIATVPAALFFQMFEHPLTERGLAEFAGDWQAVPQ